MGFFKGLVCKAFFTLPFINLNCLEGPITQGIQIDTQKVGLVAESDFYVPGEYSYVLSLGAKLPNVDRSNSEEISKAFDFLDNLIGSGAASEYCRGQVEYSAIPPTYRTSLGKPFPLHVVISDNKSGETIYDKTVNSLCISSISEYSYRTLLKIDLKEGNYHIKAYSDSPHPAFSLVETILILEQFYIK
jgi:hypothetical protein